MQSTLPSTKRPPKFSKGTGGDTGKLKIKYVKFNVISKDELNSADNSESEHQHQLPPGQLSSGKFSSLGDILRKKRYQRLAILKGDKNSHNGKMDYSAENSNKRVLKFKIFGNIKLVKDVFKLNGFLSTKGDDFSVVWSSQHLKSYFFSSIGKFQKINLFPHSWECTRKDALARNINRMSQIFGKKLFSFFPECYIWPLERSMILQAMSSSFGSPWIVKPAGSSQGKGISIITSSSQLLQEKDNRAQGKSDDNLIVERYIDKPLLIRGHKFDLRLYVAVTSFDPLKIYLYKEGIVRFATEKYVSSDYDRKYVHLTNYSVNKKNKDFLANRKETSMWNDSKQEDDIAMKKSPSPSENEYLDMSCGIMGMATFQYEEDKDDKEEIPDLDGSHVLDGNKSIIGSSMMSEIDGQDDNSIIANLSSANEMLTMENLREKKNELRSENSDSEPALSRLKWSLAELEVELKTMGIDVSLLWTKIEDCIVKTLISVESKICSTMTMSMKCPDSCFELFGFDILLDEECNPWLMEVNFSPSLSTDSEFDWNLKSKLLVDLFNLVGIPSVDMDKDALEQSQTLHDGTPDRNPLSLDEWNGQKDEKIDASNKDHAINLGQTTTTTTPTPPPPVKSTSMTESSKVVDFIFECLGWNTKEQSATSINIIKEIRRFLQESNRASTLTDFERIFPRGNNIVDYKLLFQESRPFNESLWRFVFLWSEYEKLESSSGPSEMTLQSAIPLEDSSKESYDHEMISGKLFQDAEVDERDEIGLYFSANNSQKYSKIEHDFFPIMGSLSARDRPTSSMSATCATTTTTTTTTTTSFLASTEAENDSSSSDSDDHNNNKKKDKAINLSNATNCVTPRTGNLSRDISIRKALSSKDQLSTAFGNSSRIGGDRESSQARQARSLSSSALTTINPQGSSSVRSRLEDSKRLAELLQGKLTRALGKA